MSGDEHDAGQGKGETVAIDGTALFERKRATFGAQGSNAVFKADYLAAANAALHRVAQGCDIAVPTLVTAETDNIGLVDYQLAAFERWLEHYIVLAGNYKLGAFTAEELRQLAEAEMAIARSIRDRATREADDDGDEIGLRNA